MFVNVLNSEAYIHLKRNWRLACQNESRNLSQDI